MCAREVSAIAWEMIFVMTVGQDESDANTVAEVLDMLMFIRNSDKLFQ